MTSHNQSEQPHILFLFSDTGGGHRSAADAIIEAITLEYPGKITAEMVDIFREYAPPPLDMAPEIYPPLSRMPDIWKLGYRISNGRRRTSFFNNMFWPYIYRASRRLVRDHPSDLIVSIHPLTNTPVRRSISEYGIPFVTVVTDMVSTHAFWYDNHADLVIVPTIAAQMRGLQIGMSIDRIKVVGMPVADRFCQPAGDRIDLKKKLGWSQELPVVILVGGGEGMGPLQETAMAIDAARLPIELVVICGRNQKLKARLDNHAWQIPSNIYGFVKDMPDFMRAAEILVTKAGPGTISEAFIAGLPIILYSRMPGQEDGNVTYAVGEGAGIWAPKPDMVVHALSNWLNNPEERVQAVEACHRLAAPNASREIARTLAAFIGLSETH
jgi:1,2-diacylglycerol 3-beta-galactosyltransferase